MRAFRIFAVCLGVAIGATTVVARVDSAKHDEAFWFALKQHDFKLPPESTAFALSVEAVDLLASINPAVRDGIGYEALGAWVYRDELLRPDELKSLRALLMERAQRGLGTEQTDDRVFGRSFALLCLSIFAAEDLKHPTMSRSEADELLTLALSAIAREHDLRGYVATKGWAHATAHAADLLKFLARNSTLQPADGARITKGIVERLRSAGQVFVWGEDQRLALALRSVALRPNADVAAFADWCATLKADDKAVWSGDFVPSRYVAVRAQLNTIAQLVPMLPTDSSSAGEIRRLLASVLDEAN